VKRDRLRVVLRLRELEERRAQAAAARAELARREAEEQVESRRAAYAARPVPLDRLSPLHLRALELQGVGALDELQNAHVYLDDVTAERDRADGDRSVAAVRRKSVERLRDRRREATTRAAQVAAQRSLDELSLLMRGQA
jgi:flagellar biosynthesis chaperone FliJ